MNARRSLIGFLLLFWGLAFFLLGCANTIRGADLAREYYNLGNAYLDLEKYGKAAGYFRKALDLDGSLRQARFNLALALLQDGEPGQAEEVLRIILTDNPENLSVIELLAYALHRQSKEEEALAVYRQILAQSPEHANARYNLGLLLWEMEHKEAALAEFRDLLDLFPNDHDTIFNLGKLLLELNKPAEGVVYLEQYLEEQPDDVEAYLLLAEGYRIKERYDLALEAYSSALAHEEGSPEAWFFSAQILLTKIEDPEKGLTALAQALEYGFKDTGLIASLLAEPNLLEKDRVTALLEQKGLLPEPVPPADP